MRLLVDTHLLLWAALDPDRLPAVARSLLQDPGNEPLFSAVSIWEIAIKHGLGRQDFHVDPSLFRRGLLDNGYTELPITSRHATTTCTLPRIHRDPFDRMLVAQALTDEVLLLTADPVFSQYPGPIRLV